MCGLVLGTWLRIELLPIRHGLIVDAEKHSLIAYREDAIINLDM